MEGHSPLPVCSDSVLITGGQLGSVSVPVTYTSMGCGEHSGYPGQPLQVGDSVFVLSPTLLTQLKLQKDSGKIARFRVRFPESFIYRLLLNLITTGSVSFVSWGDLSLTTDLQANNSKENFQPIIATLVSLDGDMMQQISRHFVEVITNFKPGFPDSQGSNKFQTPQDPRGYLTLHQWLCRQAIKAFTGQL